MFEKKRKEWQEMDPFEELFDEEFEERFRQAFLSNPSPERAPKRPLDLSFMERQERQRKPRLRGAQVAVACLLIFVVSSLLAVHLNDHRSLASGHPLEKILYYIKGGGYTTDPSSSGREEKSQTVRVTDPEKIDAALRLMPQLYLPEYVPEGWEMKSLEVTKKTDGSCSAGFLYENEQKQSMSIEEYDGPDSEGKKPDAGEILTHNGKTFYYFPEQSGENQRIEYRKETMLLRIEAPLNKEVLLSIADQRRLFNEGGRGE